VGGRRMAETRPGLPVRQLPAARLDRATDGQVDVRVKAGRPIPLVDLRIVDDEMRDVAHDGQAAGEVVVRAPWLTQGYLKDPQNSEQLWRGGYLHTSHIGTIDPMGYFLIT